jgi:hypothetical protein
VGLLVEEYRSEIAAAWRGSVERELGGDMAIGFAVGPLLREMSLALRDSPLRGHSGAGEASAGGVPREEGLQRCAVLVRSGSPGARVAREFKLLHRAVWDVLRASARIVGADDRRAVDEWLDEALAASLDRLDRVRTRLDLLERAPAVVSPAAPAASGTPPPLPRTRPAVRPPPLPALSSVPSGGE